jgi:hypothetical protein
LIEIDFFGQTHLKPITITSISRICERAVCHKSAPRPRALARIPGWLAPEHAKPAPSSPIGPAIPNKTNRPYCNESTQAKTSAKASIWNERTF